MTRAAIASIFLVLAAGVAAGQQPPGDPAALRSALEERFEIVPLTDGIGLRPKTATGDVRFVEVSGGAISINGEPVSGRELRQRLGAQTDAVLRLSYFGPEERRAFLDRGAGEAPPREGGPAAEPPLEAPAPVPPLPPAEARPPRPEQLPDRRNRAGERVRIFGDVTVNEDEALRGQAVAVLGSVRINGEVGDQVVAVLGSVDLGPNAVVRGDVISVGGRVRRAPGAQIRGSVTEVSFADPNLHLDFHPMFDWRGFSPFAGVPRLIGTLMRFLLLVLLVSIALVVARPTVEASAERVSESPVQSTLVGIAAEILLIPAIALTAFVLAVSIIGIPLLLLIPVVLLLLILLALAGFSGTVYAVGGWTRRRLGLGSQPAFLDVLLGVTIILLPVLIGRLVAIGGWPGAPLAFLFLAVGFFVEFIAWSSGFGAILSNAATRWQARRTSRVSAP